ncbi:MAG: hypothetical protein IJ668_05690, partial [Selenomonadaceae bacterium]|nr:hypothetical protein [Selenomonadaceae bacterium]
MISIAAVPDILASYVGKPTVTDKGLSDVQTTDVTALCPCISFIAEYSYSNDVSIDEIDMNGDVVDGSEIADPIFGLTVAPVISFVKEVSIADTGLDTTAGQPSFALLCSAFSYIPTNFVSLQVYFNTKRVLGISTEVICNVETHIVRYQFINIYKDNPIEGGLDGVLVSSGDASEPI